MLHNHSKAYIKRELNNCKGEPQHIPINIKRGRCTALLAFCSLYDAYILSLFHLFNLSPLSLGRLGGDVPLRDSVKRLKSAFGNKSICTMGIISYPELA